MKILNLAEKNNSQVPFETSFFPDGQISGMVMELIDENEHYLIKSRMSSYTNLIEICAYNDILKSNGATVSLYCPYILGGRSDRRFTPNQSFDLKIVTNILNSCNFKSITVLDPHSDVQTALINCRVINNEINWIFQKYPENHEFWENKTLISPDAGSFKKLNSVSKRLNIPMISASKERDLSGNLSTEFNGDVSGKNLVIIDDICDGGRTFINLGESLKSKGSSSITLIVTHGIFSKGTELPNIDYIVTTNSYQNLEKTDKLSILNIF